MKCWHRIPVVSGLSLAAAASAQVRLSLERIGEPTSFELTTFLTQPPNEARRLYITEQAGLIKVVRDGVPLAAPFLDLSTVVYVGAEGGILGMAFHPGFASNGFVYVCYTSGIFQGGGYTHVVRYTTNPASPETVIAGSASEVIRISVPGVGFHHAGWIGFGPDQLLYVALGDAMQPTPQDLNSLLGKMIRIDVDHDDFPADPVMNYAIPPTNPFAGAVPGADEIWAFGLRNPWRNSFDRETGDFWISDVGLGRPGEINFQPPATGPVPARNYGWPCMDGSVCFGQPLPTCVCNAPNLTLPVYDYAATSTGWATIGGYVYRGSAIPELRGTYLFGDYFGRFWSFRYDTGSITQFTERTQDLGSLSVRSFGEDSSGELYVCGFSGAFRVVRACPGNCDNSTAPPRLNVNDFICFLNRFAAGDSRANCDGSTAPPILNAADFTCFAAQFTTGCP